MPFSMYSLTLQRAPAECTLWRHLPLGNDLHHCTDHNAWGANHTEDNISQQSAERLALTQCPVARCCTELNAWPVKLERKPQCYTVRADAVCVARPRTEFSAWGVKLPEKPSAVWIVLSTCVSSPGAARGTGA